LRARVGSPGIEEFVTVGRACAGELEAAMRSTGRSLADSRSILDFGCGSARVLPHVATFAPRASFSGCDVDAAAIAWAEHHYPALSWSVSRSEPPLPYAAESFELVYSVSVFSHLDEASQDRWLDEVRRVLRPGGIALLTIHGSHAFEQFRIGAVKTAWCERDAFARAPLGPDEFVFVPYVRTVFNDSELPGVPDRYGLAFHGERYVREHWSPRLGVEAIREDALTGWQDVVVCLRPA
jgi:SAM-dependent methyltransferase